MTDTMILVGKSISTVYARECIQMATLQGIRASIKRQGPITCLLYVHSRDQARFYDLRISLWQRLIVVTHDGKDVYYG